VFKRFWERFSADESGIDHPVAILLGIVVAGLLVALIYGNPSEGTGMSGGIKKAVEAMSNALGGN
jgi:hypothetical protein